MGLLTDIIKVVQTAKEGQFDFYPDDYGLSAFTNADLDKMQSVVFNSVVDQDVDIQLTEPDHFQFTLQPKDSEIIEDALGAKSEFKSAIESRMPYFFPYDSWEDFSMDFGDAADRFDTDFTDDTVAVVVNSSDADPEILSELKVLAKDHGFKLVKAATLESDDEGSLQVMLFWPVEGIYDKVKDSTRDDLEAEFVSKARDFEVEGVKPIAVFHNQRSGFWMVLKTSADDKFLKSAVSNYFNSKVIALGNIIRDEVSGFTSIWAYLQY